MALFRGGAPGAPGREAGATKWTTDPPAPPKSPPKNVLFRPPRGVRRGAPRGTSVGSGNPPRGQIPKTAPPEASWGPPKRGPWIGPKGPIKGPKRPFPQPVGLLLELIFHFGRKLEPYERPRVVKYVASAGIGHGPKDVHGKFCQRRAYKG